MLLDQPHIVRTLAFGDAYAVRTARDADAHILLPMRRIKPVDAYNDLGITVVDALQRMIEREPCRVLLILRHGILKIEHDAVDAVDIRVLDESRPLRIHEHHRAAQTEPLRSGSWNH